MNRAVSAFRDKVDEPLEGLGDVGELLSKLIEGLKGAGLLETLKKVEPWVATTAEIGEGIPLVSAVLKAIRVLTRENDPQALGRIAYTQAYRRALAEELSAAGEPAGKKQLDRDVRVLLDGLEAFELDDLPIDRALEHPFIRQADHIVDALTDTAGYDDAQRRRLLEQVHQRFTANLQMILAHGKTREKFAPLVVWSQLSTASRAANRALDAHIEHQERLFTEARVLRIEPFALSDVYVDNDCGNLTWGAIRDAKPEAGAHHDAASRAKSNPFSEEFGGRAQLLETVLGLVADPSFRDVIVIQGVAGSGKSAFTLKLCTKLREDGLHPIRVRMRDLRFDLPFREALASAIVLSDDRVFPNPSKPVPRPDDILLGGRIFEEETTYYQARICRFVVILDGWDEVSINAREGFEYRVERMLEQIRSEFFNATRSLPVRVIVTGRPSTAVTESSFLRAGTRLLTMRVLTPDQVELLWQQLDRAVKQKRLGEVARDAPSKRDLTELAPALERYRNEFNRSREGDAQRGSPRAAAGMDILGHPLLAHIAARLMFRWDGPLEQLIASPTALYRHLVDMTCVNAGQPGGAVDEVEGSPKIAGDDLRKWLRRTAVAMTVGGEESISHDELKLRLIKGWGRDEWKELQKGTETTSRDHPLTTLMVSYYFTTGLKHLGCEFVHKSFREYLFAEGLVEELKAFGRRERGALAVREPYWKDFERGDPRLDLSRTLGRMLAPGWMTREVAAHLHLLLKWEIGRRDEEDDKPSSGEAARPTKRLDLEGWARVRDTLADLWDWWGEGVHLRPQPAADGRNVSFQKQPLAHELVEWSVPQAVDQERLEDGWLPAPMRMITVDAHLGDALFTLCAAVHTLIALQAGWWTDEGAWAAWQGASPVGTGARRYQTRIVRDDATWVLFAPAGAPDRAVSRYFHNYAHRINAAGWRPRGEFPDELVGLDLREAFVGSTDPVLVLKYANISNATLATGIRAVIGVVGLDVTIARASFNGAAFEDSWIDRVDLRETDLSHATFNRCSLAHASFEGARLVHTSMRSSNLGRADFGRADLREATFTECDLTNAKLTGTALRGSELSGCRLHGATARRADVKEANLSDEQVSVMQVED
jgi:Pentapeptide repeats (9 copies)